MAKSRKRSTPKNSTPEPNRSQTDFYQTDKFDKAVKVLGATAGVSVTNAQAKFEREWKASKTNDDLSPGFEFKQLDAEGGKYRVCQIRAGFDNRVALAFLLGQNEVYWIHAWKKTKLNNRKEVELAESRARQVWARLEKRK